VLFDTHAPARITSPIMSPSAVEDGIRPQRILCLGEALVDLISERAVASLGQARAFVPHFGGAVANVAVFAARAGGAVALAGGAGDDPWGRWLLDRLERERVDVSLFELVADAQTPIAIVTVSAEGEASYLVYGDAIATIVEALAGRLEAAVRDSAALFLSTNTLVAANEREVTMRARELALQFDRPVIVDPNFRLHRWRSRADAVASANACVPGALLVRANHAEAELMTGEHDPERAALALVTGGARLVVVTLGPDGAILRGELRADVAGVPAKVLSTIGAGDAFTGVLLARLAQNDFDPPAAADALREAVHESARACERWGALE
jgi:sugar/nucleoside kinase (ribokinase family)